MEAIRIIKLPHISSSTDVIGFCGVESYKTKGGILVSDLTPNGWMILDFYLMNYLFYGVGKSQAWIYMP